jgi:predicted ArsR family transcriptional regulator
MAPFSIEGASSKPGAVQFHLEELRKKNFVHATHYAGSEWSGDQPQTAWSIQHSGREYLIRRGMLR